MRNDQDTNFNITDPGAGAAKAAARTRSMFLTNGGSMYRYLTAFLMLLGLTFFVEQAQAQHLVVLSGYLSSGNTRELHARVPGNSALDTIYEFSGDYDISGRLQIDEGAEVWFLPNSRIIDSAGGKIIADGYGCGLNRRILFRGMPVNSFSHEWGHIIVLPGADSAYFSNVRFVNFLKRNTVDVTLIYSPSLDPTDAAFDGAIDNAVNGIGACIATFSHKTWIYDAIVDSCQASFGGGAFAFIQAPAGFPITDDGRLALQNHQVGQLTIRDTRVYNNELAPTATSTRALGGAIYIASNSALSGQTGATSSGSSVFTDVNAHFTSAIVGHEFHYSNGTTQVDATVSSVLNASQVSLSTSASSSMTNVSWWSDGYTAANNVIGFLGEGGFTTGTPSCTHTVASSDDANLFERCTANNPLPSNVNMAEGGAIYVGSNSGLVIAQGTFNSDSAIVGLRDSLDANALGGAIALSAYSGNPNQTSNGSETDKMPGLSVLKTATFRGDVAGEGGAIWVGMPPINSGNPAPRLIVDAEHIVPPAVGISSIPWRDSGKIWFDQNVAYYEGGAIYSPNKVYIKGYLAPQDFPWPGGSDSVELRVEFSNNVAAVGGGSIFLNAFGGGTPDITERRSWHLHNSVNPFDSRLNPPGGVDRGAEYGASVLGGGAEFVGLRDSTFATEFNGNTVVNGNGGAVMMEDGVATGNQVPINRYFAENEYNPHNVRVPRDTFASASVFPFDQRELTRFIRNSVSFSSGDSALASYDPANPGTVHGRGGGLFVLITSQPTNVTPLDSTFISRVRFEEDTAYSGSAIWCDRYDFKFMSNQTLIANNVATSQSSAHVDLDATGISNPGDPNAGATIWADFEGPLPSYESNSRGDAIYDNQARYILRLPVSTVVGVSGADTLRGNFWGETGPDVITEINPPTGPQQQTFFIDYYKGCYTNIFEPNSNPPVTYIPDVIGTVPDTLLMEGRVYDLFDHGTDMKVADYSNRRLAIAEAFSLGLPDTIQMMHRYTRNIFDTNATYLNKIDLYQTDFQGPHPIGYPLFLQADVPVNDTNYDPYARNYTVFMVFNTTTNEFVRVNLKETKAEEGSGDRIQMYRGRLDFIPDSSVAERHPTLRQQALYTYSLLRPSTMTFDEVQRASMLEDSAALKGREYSLSPSDLLAAGDSIFTDCESGGFQAGTKWYAGERYHTLPVRPGDNILVLSRTMLWKYGPAYAIAHGLQFTIGNVLPPNFVADVPALQADQYNPNVRFVHEDVNYDGSDSAHTLFRVAGYDVNNFYDPRFLFNQGNYTQLAISVTPDLFPGDVVPAVGSPVPGQPGNTYTAAALDSVRNHVRLWHWLKQTTIFNQNITGSNGYVRLTGTPHNPDVVPGGEAVTATLTNFPPNFGSESGLLNGFPGTLGADSLGLSMWVYPPSMNCVRVPDSTMSNPDSMCIASSSSTYHFRIIVMDSLPVFQTVSNPCGAVLTDSLRYTVDLQTDDESEDSAAAAEMEAPATSLDNSQHPAWDFRYGRTQYNFQTEPSWMVEPVNGHYVQIDSANDANFRLRGIINVRLDSATAVSNTQYGGPYLLPNPQVNNELNLDTLAAVEAQDGHTGKQLQRWAVPILFVPTILNTSLPDAQEGSDYSHNFQDPNAINRILIDNKNPSQYFTYSLLYKGQTQALYRDIQNKVPLMPSDGYPNGKIGVADTVVGATPSWLHIDPYSGVLSGTPSDTDAPRSATAACGQDSVTVIVTDGTCVATWATFPLNVDSVNHSPHFIPGPHELCVTNGKAFCDSTLAYDVDLLRSPCAAEKLTFTSLDPRVTVTVASNGTDTISGQLATDTVKLNVCGTFNEPQQYFTSGTIQPEYIRLQVTDAAGNMDTLTYPVHLGDVPAFECSIYVSNAVTSLHPLQDIQKLCFGAGQFGTDSLDIIYCEFEDAPAPPSSAFDARWILPIAGQLEGSTVDIRSNGNPNAMLTWQVQFQPGNEAGGAGSLFPVQICWNSSCMNDSALPGYFAQGHFFLRNPRNSQEFSIDMNSGGGPIDNSLYTLTRIGSDSMCLQIRDQGLTNAIIVFVPAGSGVGTGTTPTFALEPNYPNPFSSATTLNFSVAQRSNVRIDIYDVKGALVRTLVNEPLEPGSYPVTWDGTDASGALVPAGNYIAHMTAGSYNASVKMSLDNGAGK